ncbi:hypothetical protein C9374_000232 [Naegleria lovaniensis]|uniref:E3 ubiquitin-protein ligase CHFR n=1 Tax=Naegleria lovaniensis TaxID=51637 RepID=A0AA88KNV4_NAELO|nr:uncharacterized protein C9374_000232 [Naegleria lovaniensis]KAG2388793.1 hypothetical protein C9374_000232 [Naegleria lovaniensis]
MATTQTQSTLDVTTEEIVLPEDDDDTMKETGSNKILLAKLVPAIPQSKYGLVEIYSTDKVIEFGRKSQHRSECIVNDGRISTTHCVLSIEDFQMEESLKFSLKCKDTSINGCFVNGKKLGKNNEVILNHGDVLGLVVPSVNHKLSSELPIYRVELENHREAAVDTTSATSQHTQELVVDEEDSNVAATMTNTNVAVASSKEDLNSSTTNTTASASNDDNEKKRNRDNYEDAQPKETENEPKSETKKQKKSLTEKEKQLLALMGATDSDMEESQEEESDMLRELTCPICSAVFYKPVSVIPCLHNFCSSCLSAWVDPSRNLYWGQTLNCPTCRAEVHEVRKNPQMNNLTESFLKNNPKKDRSKEEKESMDSKDRFLGKTDLVLYKRNGSSSNHDDSSDSDDEEREVSDDSSSDDSQPATIVAPRCPECLQASTIDGFQCPANALHCLCSFCHCTLPHRVHDTTLSQDRRLTCELCHAVHCNLYKQTTNTADMCFMNGIHKLKEHSAIIAIPPTCLSNNQHERDILINYIQSKSISPQDVYNTCMTSLENGTFTNPTYTSVTTETRVCKQCAIKVFSDLIYQYRAAIPNSELPQSVTSRPNCWYGMECRTMSHNRGHAQRYNHICPNTSNARR